MRKTISLSLVALGFVLQAASYFWLAAPWEFQGSPIVSTEARMQFAPLIFIGGIALVFLAAVVYEIMPRRKSE